MSFLPPEPTRVLGPNEAAAAGCLDRLGLAGILVQARVVTSHSDQILERSMGCLSGSFSNSLYCLLHDLIGHNSESSFLCDK